jgi:preprotein translocase subunit SecA
MQGVDEMVDEMLDFYIEQQVNEFPEDLEEIEDQDIDNFISMIGLSLEVSVKPDEVRNLLEEGGLTDHIFKLTKENLDSLKSEFGEEKARKIFSDILRVTIDEKWKEHLLEMDYLKRGIHMRGYAQVDPKIEYKREGYALFEQLADSIKINVAERLIKVARESLEKEVQFEEEMREVFQIDNVRHDAIGSMDEAARVAAQHSETGGEAAGRVETIVNTEDEPGPNDPCPCGSGKKYKKCCKAN